MISVVLENRYELLDILGRGGMAEVYRAHDRRVGRDVAIKLLNARCSQDPGLLERFRQESRALARLSDPHIVTLLDNGETNDGRLYLVMERLRGETLQQRIERLCEHGERMPWAQIAEIVRQVCRALETAHAENIIHRDIKPSNLFLSAGDFVKILDFGVAKILAAEPLTGGIPGLSTESGVIYGTPHYLAPEAIAPDTYGPIGPQVDVFALGVVLYKVIAGVLPREGLPYVTVLDRTAFEDPVPPSERSRWPVDPRIDAIVMRAIARDPRDRFARVCELAESLAAVDVRTPGGRVSSPRDSPVATQSAEVGARAPGGPPASAGRLPLGVAAPAGPVGDKPDPETRPRRISAGVEHDALHGPQLARLDESGDPPTGNVLSLEAELRTTPHPRADSSLRYNVGMGLVAVTFMAVIVTAWRALPNVPERRVMPREPAVASALTVESSERAAARNAVPTDSIESGIEHEAVQPSVPDDLVQVVQPEPAAPGLPTLPSEPVPVKPVDIDKPRPKPADPVAVAATKRGLSEIASAFQKDFEECITTNTLIGETGYGMRVKLIAGPSEKHMTVIELQGSKLRRPPDVARQCVLKGLKARELPSVTAPAEIRHEFLLQ